MMQYGKKTHQDRRLQRHIAGNPHRKRLIARSDSRTTGRYSKLHIVPGERAAVSILGNVHCRGPGVGCQARRDDGQDRGEN